MMRLMLVGFCALLWAASAHGQEWNVKESGAAGDGQTDDTAAFQQALDAAAEAGGGVVHVPAGHYRINGNLRIPGAVTLKGVFSTPPTDQREGRAGLDGSVLLAYAGRGSREGEPFIRLAGSMAVLQGFMVAYPEWSKEDVPPIPYPPTVASSGTANTAVVDCCFLNSYEAIVYQGAARFLVRNVHGYPSFRGLYVDECYDIGRVENVHYWPFGVVYRPDDPYCEWVNLNGVAFEFARTDWQYVTNTFCFGYGVGYKFSASKAGACNGNFLGIGADCCRRAVLVEDSQPPGILITNGELVGRWGSGDSVGVEIAEGAGKGKVSLSNCSFWGPIDRCVWLRSPDMQFTSVATNYCQWDVAGKGSPAIQLDAGKAIIDGNTFADYDLHVAVGPKVASAILIANQADGGIQVHNEAGKRTQMLANESNELDWPEEAKTHYRIDVGRSGDSRFLRRWHGREAAGEWPEDKGTKRWSQGESFLRLPVEPGRSYALRMEVMVPDHAASPDNGLFLGDARLAALPDKGIGEATAAIPPQQEGEVQLVLRVKVWTPAKVMPDNQDYRELGVAVRSVTLEAQDAVAPLYDANTGTVLDE